MMLPYLCGDYVWLLLWLLLLREENYKCSHHQERKQKRNKESRNVFNICFAAGSISKGHREKKELNTRKGEVGGSLGKLEEKTNTGSNMAGLD